MIIQSLLGRVDVHGNEIVAIYQDVKGELVLVLENVDGRLFETSTYGILLPKETHV